MKEKQWIPHLAALAAPLLGSAETQASPEQAEEYFNQVDQLSRECQAIVDERLARLRPLGQKDDPLWPTSFMDTAAIERRVAAYREGLVKWDAVVHGVSQALGEPAPFPLFKGVLVINDMTKLRQDLSDGKVSATNARLQRDVFERVVRGLAYQDLPVFKSMFDFIDDGLNSNSIKQVEKIGSQLAELVGLVQSGQGQSARAQALQAKVYHMRHELSQAIQSLPPSQQMQALFLLGEKVIQANFKPRSAV